MLRLFFKDKKISPFPLPLFDRFLFRGSQAHTVLESTHQMRYWTSTTRKSPVLMLSQSFETMPPTLATVGEKIQVSGLIWSSIQKNRMGYSRIWNQRSENAKAISILPPPPPRRGISIKRMTSGLDQKSDRILETSALDTFIRTLCSFLKSYRFCLPLPFPERNFDFRAQIKNVTKIRRAIRNYRLGHYRLDCLFVYRSPIIYAHAYPPGERKKFWFQRLNPELDHQSTGTF